MTLNPNHFTVIDFHYIDDRSCCRPLDYGWEGDGLEELRAMLGRMFLDHGWEGDGEIEVIPVAPFLCGADDGWCVNVYHVKQMNNGTSWLAIPKSLYLSLPELFISRAGQFSEPA